MKEKLARLKTTRYYGFLLLAAMTVFFYAVFKILTPGNFGSPDNLLSYLQSSIIYAVGGCGLYFIVVMGLFDFAIGANVVLSSIVGVICSKQFGYAGFILGTLACATLIGTLIGFLYNSLQVPSGDRYRRPDADFRAPSRFRRRRHIADPGSGLLVTSALPKPDSCGAGSSLMWFILNSYEGRNLLQRYRQQ